MYEGETTSSHFHRLDLVHEGDDGPRDGGVGIFELWIVVRHDR
jgi:hypothetical protein